MKILAVIIAGAAAFDNGAPNSRLPPLGWSSWEAFGPGTEHPVRDYCDENSIKAAADAFIATGLYAAGYRHFHLDDCWSTIERVAGGPIQPDPNRFPNGMKVSCTNPHAIAQALIDEPTSPSLTTSTRGTSPLVFIHLLARERVCPPVLALMVIGRRMLKPLPRGGWIGSNRIGVACPTALRAPKPRETCPQH